MNILYVDTNAWIALFNRRDSLAKKFSIPWQTINEEKTRLLTSNEVMSETLNFIAQRLTAKHAAEVGRLMLKSSLLTIEQVTREDQLASFKLLEKFAGQDIGYTDCTSFAVMQRLGLQRVFTQDHHFSIAGFELWPGPVRRRKRR